MFITEPPGTEVTVEEVPLILTLIVIVVELGSSLSCQCSSQIRKSPLQLTHHCTCTECENTCPTLKIIISKEKISLLK